MKSSWRVRGILATVFLAAFGAMLLPGCGKKEEAASGPGYYTGPMQPKGGGKGPIDGGQKGGAQGAAGSPQ